MTGWLVAGIGFPIMGWLLLHFVQKCTKLGVKIENLERVITVKDKQLAIGSLHADTVNDVDQWLSKNG